MENDTHLSALGNGRTKPWNTAGGEPENEGVSQKKTLQPRDHLALPTQQLH